MRTILIALALTLLLAGTALAARDSDRYERAERDRDRYEYSVDPFFFEDPFRASTLGSANDRGGYRVFIPRGLQGRQYYGDASDYRRANPRRYQGGYQRDGYGYSYHDPYDVRNYRGRRAYRRGAYTIQNYGFEYGYGYPAYGPPTYVYPGDGTIVIDGRPEYVVPPAAPLPPQFRGGDGGDGGDVYNDNRVYDNSQTTNNYFGDAPAPAPQAKPKAQGVNPAPRSVEQKIGFGKPFGTRFTEQARFSTPQGPRVFKLKGDTLVSGIDGNPLKQVAAGVDPDFGAYAVYEPDAGSAVIFKQGDSIAVAYPVEDGQWWVEKLPAAVDFGIEPTIGMVTGEPWVTFSAPDGTRWVYALSGHQWREIGSGRSGGF
jgi:hypothetical protein